MKLLAKSKINFTLDITGKRDDGYHLLSTIMQTLDLSDEVEVNLTKEDITVRTNLSYLPADKNNIAYKAAKAFSEHFEIDTGVDIIIKKNIPVSAGMAGGSTDAAAVLKALNSLTGINTDTQTLMKIGEKVGADVPFCITGGTALAEGIGEIVTPLTPFNDVIILLAKPSFSVSTQEVFKAVKIDKIIHHPDTKGAIDAINSHNVYDLCDKMKNVLENVTLNMHPKIREIKKDMLRYGAINSMMTGSGPTVFGVFDSIKDAEYAKAMLENKVKFTHIAKTSI